jgi:hypothetical protein
MSTQGERLFDTAPVDEDNKGGSLELLTLTSLLSDSGVLLRDGLKE